MESARLGKVIQLSLFIVVELSTSVFAGPTTIVDDEIDQSMYVWEGSPYSYTHDITDEPGYSPSLVLNSAQLQLQFEDDYDGPYGSQAEYVTVLYDGTSWDVGEVDSGPYGLNVVPSLLADGRLNVQVSVDNQGAGLGYVRLKDSKLTVCGGAPDASPTAPTPGALLLAATGVGVVGWLRTRRAL